MQDTELLSMVSKRSVTNVMTKVRTNEAVLHTCQRDVRTSRSRSIVCSCASNVVCSRCTTHCAISLAAMTSRLLAASARTMLGSVDADGMPTKRAARAPLPSSL